MLYSSNASQMELIFQYPKELFKYQEEQLTKLRIKHYLNGDANLIENFS